MCAAALPPGMDMGRQGEGMHTGMAALVASCNGKLPERKEPRNTTPKWDTRTPTTTSLAQFDRDKSSRHIGAKLLQSQTGLFTLGPSNAKVEKANDRLLQPSTASKRHHNNDGGDDRPQVLEGEPQGSIFARVR